MKYRPDIDGLRAVAVLSVVLFHAFPSLMKGGFIGVDIFFVISGFLITKILFSNLDNNKFSVVDFYSRRINRIYPALLVVLVFCLCFGWFALLADEFKQLGKHTAGGAGFVANLVLWSETGYFDNLSETKPLLHLWSLGIEEQFYIVWPLLLWAVWKVRAHKLSVIVLIFAASFLANVLTVTGDPSAAFYSPLTRFWELLAGSLLAYSSMYHGTGRALSLTAARLPTGKSLPDNSNALLANGVSLTGSVLIAVGLFTITKENMFPGYWALLPVLGSALVISAGPEAWINKYILSNRLMVFIGLISFPLYLWHWPLLSFVRVIEGEVPATENRAAAVAIAFAGAFLTYQFVEKPVRFRAKGAKRTVGLLLLMIVTGTAGYLVYSKDGVPNRAMMTDLVKKSNDLNIYTLSKCENEELKKIGMSWCNQSHEGKPVEVILWGDSHAEHLFPGIKSSFQENWLIIGRHSCPPILGENEWLTSAPGSECAHANDKAIEIIRQSPAHTVVLSWLGNVYFTDKGITPEHKRIADDNPQNRYVIGEANDVSHKQELFLKGMKASIQAILASGKKVVLVKDTPEFLLDPRACLFRPMKIRTQDCSVTTAAYEERSKAYTALLQELSSMSSDITVFDTASIFCDDKKCSPNTADDMFFRDGHHLSNTGSQKVGAALERFMRNQH